MTVGEIEPLRGVSCRPVSAASGEGEVDGAEALRDGGGPPEEHVGDHAGRRPALFSGHGGHELVKGRFEGRRGVEELAHLGQWNVLGVLGSRREAVVGAVKRELGEVDLRRRRRRRDGGAEVLAVEGGGGDGDVEGGGSSALDLLGQL